MDLEIIMGEDGSVIVRVDNTQGVTYEEARARVQAFLAQVGLTGAPLVITGEIERHVHDDYHVHQHVHTH